jgi:hypothetical protein
MSELIFDEESDDVGADIEAYCPKCKGDTAHTIITKYEEEIRRVQCSPCGDVHSYRKPRGEADEDVPEPTGTGKKKAVAKKPAWQEAIDKIGNKLAATARVYSIRDTYDEGDWMTHPKFGYGIVTELYENKVEVTFEDERRVLLHNRPDLAAQMPAIASMPAPREDKKKKGRGKRGKAAAAPVAAPPPPPVAEKVKGKAAKPAPAAKPVVAKAKPAERAKAAAAKKGAAKGKAAAKPKQAKAAPKAKAAAKKAAARASRASRAARPARPVKKPAKAAKKR